MADIDQLVEKFKAQLSVAHESQKFKDSITPIINKVFTEDFQKTFEELANQINDRLGFKVVTVQPEGKNRFIIQGQHHRVYFQKGKIDFGQNVINVSIIPIYVWKGVTKHLGPISFFINPENNEVKWDILSDSVDEYSKNLFGKLVDDEDFFM